MRQTACAATSTTNADRTACAIQAGTTAIPGGTSARIEHGKLPPVRNCVLMAPVFHTPTTQLIDLTQVSL